MKLKTEEFIIKDNANRLNEIIRTEIKAITSNKRHNFSGKYSDDAGFDLFSSNSLVSKQPNLGPLVKLNLKSVNINTDGTESKLILKRKNGVSYNIHFGFIFFFVVLTSFIAFYQILTKGFNDGIMFLVLPVFGVIYFLILELLANSNVADLIKRIEKILKAEKIEYKKL